MYRIWLGSIRGGGESNEITRSKRTLYNILERVSVLFPSRSVSYDIVFPTELWDEDAAIINKYLGCGIGRRWMQMKLNSRHHQHIDLLPVDCV